MKLIIGLGFVLLVSSVSGYGPERMEECPLHGGTADLLFCYDDDRTFLKVYERNDDRNKTMRLKLYERTNNTITQYAFNNLSHIRTMVIESYQSTISIPELSFSQDAFAGMLELELEELKLRQVVVNFDNQNPFGPLRSLKVLGLRNIGLGEIAVEMLASLPILEKLVLEMNCIDTIHRNSFAALKNLKFLDLTNNNIAHIEPGAFNGLSELKELILDDNRIELKAGMFQGMPKLKVLKLTRSSHIRTLEDCVFDGLPGLTELYLIENGFERISPDAFQKLESLKILQLRHSRIQDFPKNLFRGLKLHKLHLTNNNISKIKTDSFQGLKVIFLDLNSNGIKDLEAGAFNGLIVKELRLRSNNLTKIDTDDFNGFHAGYLDLSKNCIETIAKDAFKGAVMKEVSIYGNAIERPGMGEPGPFRAEWDLPKPE